MRDSLWEWSGAELVTQQFVPDARVQPFVPAGDFLVGKEWRSKIKVL